MFADGDSRSFSWPHGRPRARSACGRPTRDATLSATIATLASLTLSTATLTFPDADPDALGQVPPLAALS